VNCELTHLSNLCKVITKGTTPTTIGFDFSEKGIGFLRAQNINDGKVDYNRNTLFIDEQTHKALSRSQILPGDILLSIAGTIGRAGIVPDNSPELNCNQAVAIVRTNGKVFRPFLRHWLESLDAQKQMRGAMVTGTISNLSLTQVGNLQIPLPPMEEQQQIADILDRAEALRAKRKTALAQLDEITQSIFIEMFGDPVKNPKNWNLIKVQDVMSQIEAGWSANGEYRPREENAVTQGVFLPEECKVINNDIEFKKVVTPEKGDVLFSRANTLELVGASCLIRENYPYLLLPDKLWKIRVNEEKICPEYFKFVLSYPTVRHEISKLSTGTSGSMYNISMEKFRQIDITVPPIEIQKKFSIIIGKIDKIRKSHQQSLLELNNLFDSLSHAAFTGKLFSHQFFEQEIENGVKI